MKHNLANNEATTKICERNSELYDVWQIGWPNLNQKLFWMCLNYKLNLRKYIVIKLLSKLLSFILSRLSIRFIDWKFIIGNSDIPLNIKHLEVIWYCCRLNTVFIPLPSNTIDVLIHLLDNIPDRISPLNYFWIHSVVYMWCHNNHEMCKCEMDKEWTVKRASHQKIFGSSCFSAFMKIDPI